MFRIATYRSHILLVFGDTTFWWFNVKNYIANEGVAFKYLGIYTDGASLTDFTLLVSNTQTLDDVIKFCINYLNKEK